MTEPIPFIEIIDPDSDFKYRFITTNGRCVWRAKTLFTKEPDTIKWLANIPQDDVLIDIGANVGVYTVFAARRGIKVMAIEPEAQNYAALCKNIIINELKNTFAYCIALADVDRLDILHLPDCYAGSSGHSFSENLDHRLSNRSCTYMQGAVGMRLDSLNIKADYIKIDVDGLEHKVVAGGINTLQKAKSALIEINNSLPEHLVIVKTMLDFGFKYDQMQIESSRRTEGAFAGCGNYIFYR